MGNPADSLTLLSTFVRVAEAGALSAAARSLGTSQASVSRQLAALEARLGVSLARRSTQGLTLTAEGQALLPRARALIAEWQEVAESFGEARPGLSGTLRVVVPSGLGPTIAAPLAASFTREHPGVSIDFTLTDGPVDLVAAGIDLMLRVGPVAGQDLVVRRIGTIRRWLVARPEVVAPDSAAATQGNKGLPLVVLRSFYDARLTLRDRTGAAVTLKGVVRLATDGLAAAYEATLAGGGAAILPDWLIRDDLARGRLVRIAPHLEAEPAAIHLAFPPGRFRPARTRLFAAALEAAVKSQVGS